MDLDYLFGAVHISGNLVLNGNRINRNHAAIGEFQFHTAVIEVKNKKAASQIMQSSLEI